MLSRNSGLTPLQVEQFLENFADDKGAPGRDNEFGFGRINIFNTLSNVPLDTTAPSKPVVTDDGATTNNNTQLHAVWAAASDAESGISSYEYSIGTTTGATNTVGWTDNGLTTSVTKSSLTLSSGTTYYVNVRAINGAGITGSAASSDGIKLDSSVLVYRFWSESKQEHFYTTSLAERDHAIATWPTIWSYESIAFYAKN